jgi:hypothetical protein
MFLYISETEVLRSTAYGFHLIYVHALINTHTYPFNQWPSSSVGIVNRLRAGHRRICSASWHDQEIYLFAEVPGLNTGPTSLVFNGPMGPYPSCRTCNANHQLYHLTMSRMKGATSSHPQVPSWAPKRQPFITLSFLDNCVTLTYVA